MGAGQAAGCICSPFLKSTTDIGILRHLIPEEVVHDRSGAVALADRVLEEADALWAVGVGWRAEEAGDPRHGVPRLESCPVGGPLAAAGVRLWRARAELRGEGCEADRVVRLLASPEGYALLQPGCRQDGADGPERFSWRPGGLLQVEHLLTDVPKLAKTVSLLVLTAAGVGPAAAGLSGSTRVNLELHKRTSPPISPQDPGQQGQRGFLIRKSCLHPRWKGHSEYASHLNHLGGVFARDEGEGDQICRGLITLAVLAEPLSDGCQLVVTSWLELCLPRGRLHRAMDQTNKDNKRFLASLFARVRARLRDASDAGLEAPDELGAPFREPEGPVQS